MLKGLLTSFIIISFVFALPMGAMGLTANGTEYFLTQTKTSFGPTIDACFAFDSNGTLNIAGAGASGQLTWAYKRLGKSKFGWQAVGLIAGGGGPVEFALSGTKGFLFLFGDGVDANGATYSIKGKRVKEPCVF